MNILLSNDDGIHAEGIKILQELLAELGHEVNVIAPKFEQSGTSHSVTFKKALITEKVYVGEQYFGLAMHGFPSDCVRAGLKSYHSEVDIIACGINLGNNAGPAIYYSGTIAGAYEGYCSGHPALAFSLNSYNIELMRGLRTSLKPFMPELLTRCNKNYLYNINIPGTKKIKGLRLTRQAQCDFKDEYVKRISPYGNDYLWLKGNGFTRETQSGRQDYPNDLDTLQEGYISLTPLQFDLTNYHELQGLEEKFQDISQP